MRTFRSDGFCMAKCAGEVVRNSKFSYGRLCKFCCVGKIWIIVTNTREKNRSKENFHNVLSKN